MVIKNNFKKSLENERDKKISILLKDLNSLESYINDIFVFSPLPISFISPSGVILESNPAFIKISGFKFDEIIGKAIESFFEKRKAKELIETTMEKESVQGIEASFFSKTKKEIPCQIFTRVRKDEKGEKVGYFLSIVDLTEIKKTQRDARKALMSILQDVQEEKNRAEEEKNKTLAIITNFSDGILVFDKANNLLLINPRAEEFFGVEGKEIIGKSVSTFKNIASLKPLLKLFKSKSKQIFREELEITQDLILEISMVPVIKEKQKMGILIILHNITREKLIEKMKSEFVSLAAHQLRTPLSAMKWSIKMILDEELGKINKEQKDFLEDSYRSNERMIYLINDLLDVTRIEEGKFIYNLTSTDIEQIVQFTIKSYKDKEVKNKKLKIELKKPAKKLPKVMIDIEKIRMVIENLLDNATSYSNPGSKIVISLKHIEKGIEFSIKDEGIGIPKKQHTRVFSKFFRGSNVMKIDTDGNGLGLYIAKNIIKAHKGEIWFESELNKGTTFYFRLPIKSKT